MKIRKLMKLGVIAAVSASMFGCGGGGGGGTSSTSGGTSSTVTKSGKVVDGYLKGATVFADCNGNGKYDIGIDVPALGPTDENGTFVINATTTCDIVAMGGIDTATENPFDGILMAPPDTKNVTPLTTLITVNPALESKLKEVLGNLPVDVDYVSQKVPGTVVKLASTVATAVNLASSVAPEKTKVAEKVIKQIAEKLSTITDLENDTALTDAVASAATEALEEVANETPEIQNATAIGETLKEAIQSIASSIPSNETVSFNDVASVIKQVHENATSKIKNYVTKYIPDSIEISGKETNIQQDKFSLSVPLGNIEENKKVEVSFETKNPVSGVRSYNATMTVNVSDRDSKRRATLVLSPVNISVEDGNLKSITVPKGATLVVTGTDSLGNPVGPITLKNEQPDSTFDGTIGTCESSSTPGGCFYYDLAVVEKKIQSQVSQNNPLYEITNKLGTFDVSISIDGIPVDPVIGKVTVYSLVKVIPVKFSFAGKEAELREISHNKFSFGTLNLDENSVEGNKVLAVKIDVKNADSINNEETYTVSLTANRNDKKSSRKATVKLNDVRVTIDNTGEIEKIEVPEGAALEINGTDSNGNPVYAKVKNDIADVIDVENGNTFKFDLSRVEEKLSSSEVPEALKDISYPGEYQIDLNVEGLPTPVEITGTVNVAEAENTTGTSGTSESGSTAGSSGTSVLPGASSNSTEQSENTTESSGTSESESTAGSSGTSVLPGA